MGFALRATFPTHIGERFDKGVGAPNLYSVSQDQVAPYTNKGLLWAIEPGVIASVAAIDHFTFNAELT